MSLLSRLVSPASGELKLPVHQFMAAMAELRRAAPGVTVATVSTSFGLSVGEQTELQALVTSQFLDRVPRELVHDVLMLGEDGHYTLQQVQDRLVNVLPSLDLWPLITQRAFQVVARGLNDCVLAGCAVTAQGAPDMTVAVARGAVLSAGLARPVTAGNVSLSAAHATLPRIDIVVVNGSGTKVVREGTPAPRPAPGTLSADDVSLAFVLVPPGDAQVTSDQILDTRMFQTSGPICIGKVTTALVFSNTSAAQNLLNFTVPAGLFLAGRIIRVRMGGTFQLNSGTPTLTLRIAYGGTTMFQDVTAAATADADRLAWSLSFVVVAQGNSDQALSGVLELGPLNAKTAPNTGVGEIAVPAAVAGVQVSAPISGSAAVDSDAADQQLLVQMTMSVANAADQIAMEYALGEIL